MDGNARQSRTRPTREQTRARLLAAAVSVFARRGFASASVEDVAAAAGLTKGAVYSSFASKEQLILAVMEERITARLCAAGTAFAAAGDPGSGANRVGTRLIEAVHADADWQRLFIDYWTHAMREPRLRRHLAERRGELRATIATAIRRAVEEQDVSLAVTPEELAVTLLALSNGLAIESEIDSTAVPEDLFGRLLGRLATS